MKNKSAIYIRVSTHWQIDKDSLQTQRRELIAYSELVLGISEYEVFEDPGYSAKNTDRPAYQNMMSRLRTGEFSHLLVWKIDRISRNLIDFTTMYAELKSLGVTFVSKNEQFDTSSAIGEAMLKIILVFAELERKMTGERVSAVMLSRANEGKWNGGKIPYGYERKDSQFVVVPSEAEIIRQIANEYLSGKSIINITRNLNANGITVRNGAPWNTVMVHRILTSAFYVGDYVYNRHDEQQTTFKYKNKSEWITFENHHEPILRREDHAVILKMLERNRRGGHIGETYTRKNVHMFAGLIRCGSCGANMIATLDKQRASGWRPSIYGCSTRRKNQSVCQNKYISDVTVGAFIFALVGAILRLHKQVTKSTQVDTVKRRILNSVPVADVEGADRLLLVLKSNLASAEYKPQNVFEPTDIQTVSEKDLLATQKRKQETALKRLQTIYLYGDAEIPESEYLTQRKHMMDELEAINKRLDELSSAPTPTTEDAKMSYQIMTKYLEDPTKIDFERFARTVDTTIPKNFFRTIIDHMDALDGHIVSVTFTNSVRLDFKY